VWSHFCYSARVPVYLLYTSVLPAPACLLGLVYITQAAISPPHACGRFCVCTNWTVSLLVSFAVVCWDVAPARLPPSLRFLTGSPFGITSFRGPRRSLCFLLLLRAVAARVLLVLYDLRHSTVLFTAYLLPLFVCCYNTLCVPGLLRDITCWACCAR